MQLQQNISSSTNVAEAFPFQSQSKEKSEAGIENIFPCNDH